jgi:hypothetical protein
MPGMALSWRRKSWIWSSSRPAIFCLIRPMNIASSWPFVVSSPVREPVEVRSAFVATVVPWLKLVVSARSFSVDMPSCFAARPRLSMTPIEKSCGVEGAFAGVTLPWSSMTMQSVNVPPVSMPIR